MPALLTIDESVGDAGGRHLDTALCFSILQQRIVERHHIRTAYAVCNRYFGRLAWLVELRTGHKISIRGQIGAPSEVLIL